MAARAEAGIRLRRAGRAMVLFCLAVCAAASAAPAGTFKLKIIAFNDFHGNLQSPGSFQANALGPSVPAGGIDYLAGYVEKLKAENPNSMVVSAGDLIGASPLVSSLFHDEGTIETMNRLGLSLSAVGNHEFDHGKAELLRMQKGGCSKQDSDTCKGADAGTPFPFEGAKFEFLAANVFDTATGETIFPGYAIETYHGVRVAFIGLALRDTPTVTTPEGVAGLRFADEAETINGIVRQLRRQGVECFVVLIHQGGRQTTAGTADINACEGGLEGTPIRKIVGELDDAVDLVISAHSHQAYVCQIPNSAGRPITVTQAGAYGRLLTDIDMTIDTATKKATAVNARNMVVERTEAAGIKPDAAIRSIVEKYAALAAPISNRVVGSITADLRRDEGEARESALGDVIADAQLEATQAEASGDAAIAFMNPTGIRSSLSYRSSVPGVPDGEVTYGELFTVQPFGNSLMTMTLNGAQIKTLLEEQFRGCTEGYPAGSSNGRPQDQILQVSEGFTYTWDPAGPACKKVDSNSMKVGGMKMEPDHKYRVTVNSFLADGGDQFFVLTQGTERTGGQLDIEALTGYFAKHPQVVPHLPNRVEALP